MAVIRKRGGRGRAHSLERIASGIGQTKTKMLANENLIREEESRIKKLEEHLEKVKKAEIKPDAFHNEGMTDILIRSARDRITALKQGAEKNRLQLEKFGKMADSAVRREIRDISGAVDMHKVRQEEQAKKAKKMQEAKELAAAIGKKYIDDTRKTVDGRNRTITFGEIKDELIKRRFPENLAEKFAVELSDALFDDMLLANGSSFAVKRDKKLKASLQKSDLNVLKRRKGEREEESRRRQQRRTQEKDRRLQAALGRAEKKARDMQGKNNSIRGGMRLDREAANDPAISWAIRVKALNRVRMYKKQLKINDAELSDMKSKIKEIREGISN
ncbi:MAG: hypothetical protein V1911_00445 [Candidatus Micrarchaeota archaeon]